MNKQLSLLCSGLPLREFVYALSSLRIGIPVGWFGVVWGGLGLSKGLWIVRESVCLSAITIVEVLKGDSMDMIQLKCNLLCVVEVLRMTCSWGVGGCV